MEKEGMATSCSAECLFPSSINGKKRKSGLATLHVTRRDRFMLRQHTINLTPDSSVRNSLEDIEIRTPLPRTPIRADSMRKRLPLLATSSIGGFVNTSVDQGGNDVAFACDNGLRPRVDTFDSGLSPPRFPQRTPSFMKRRSTITRASMDTQMALVVPSPQLLRPPNLIEAGLMFGEAKPHRKDTYENIHHRVRSQSWLVRARHLLDDENLAKQGPFILKLMQIFSILLVILTFPFCIPFCLRIAKEYERAVVFRLGRLTREGTRGPGIFFVMPCIDTYKIEILSRDTVTVSVEAVIYFRISNPVISVTNVNDAQFSTKLLAQTTLRNVLGTKTLTQILKDREHIASVTEKVLDDGTEPWGVKVQRVEIKDIRLPRQLMRTMASEAEATRGARANVIAADGERNASRSLLQAANTMNKVALQLRYLQTLSHIAAQRNHTIVIPFPVEVARTVIQRTRKLIWS